MLGLQLPVHGKQMQALFCAFMNAGHPKTAVLLYMTFVTDSHAVYSTLWQHLTHYGNT